GMRLMKKDMAGAAIVLGLAQAIMDAGLPVRLRVLLPLVENAVSGNAVHPMDIVRTRKGLTVEIGNTDAEGRLILCDALAGAVTAALYLQEFVERDIPWAHLDVMAWNPQSRPGRPEGAEATALRALYAHISQRFG